MLHEFDIHYRQLFESMNDAFLLVRMTYDDAGIPASYQYLEANPAMEKLAHLNRHQILGGHGHELLPIIEPHWMEAFDRVAKTGVPESVEYYSKDPGCWYRVYACRIAPETIALIYSDITEHKKTQAELEKTSRELQNLTVNAPDVIGRVDRELRHLFVNRVIADFTGIANTEFVGKTVEELGFPAQLCELWSENFREVFDAGEGRELEFSFPSSNGVRYFHMRAVPEFGADDKVETVMFITRDITNLKVAEEALGESDDRFRIMADGTPVMIWATDPGGVIDFVNRTYCDFFGVTAQEVIQHGWQPLVHPDDSEPYVSEFERALKKRRSFQAEARVRRYDGQWRWIASYGSPRFSAFGRFLGMVGSSPDITDMKKAEETVRDVNKTLEERVIEKNREVLLQADQLRALANRLREVEQRERKRLSKIVHDHIQQHIVAAQMRLESIKAELQTGILQDTVETLKTILSGVLESSRSLVSELSPQGLRAAGLIGGLNWLAQQMKEEHGLSVNLRYDGDAEPESESLQLLVFDFLRELLLNIAKHADTQHAEVTLSRSGGSVLTLIVRDNGNGFDPYLMNNPRLLDSGFGLFSIRERLAHLGGSMDIESKPGEGARIALKIPIREDEAPLQGDP